MTRILIGPARKGLVSVVLTALAGANIKMTFFVYFYYCSVLGNVRVKRVKIVLFMIFTRTLTVPGTG